MDDPAHVNVDSSGDLPGRSLDDRLDAQGFEAGEARLTVAFPRGTTFVSDRMNTIQAADGTRIRLRLSRAGLDLACNPPILVHVKRAVVAHVERNVEGWVEDILLGGVHYDFRRGRVELDFERVARLDAFDPTDSFRAEIAGKLQQLIAGTPLAQPGYDPQADPDIEGTLRHVARRLEDGATRTRKKFPDVVADSVQASIGLRTRRSFEFRDGDAAVAIPMNASLEIRTGIDNSDAEVAAWLNDWRKKATPRLSSLEIESSPGITIRLLDPATGRLRDAVRIHRAVLRRGAKFDIIDFRILELPGAAGKAARAEKALEQGFLAAMAVLVEALRLQSQGGVSPRVSLHPEGPLGGHMAKHAVSAASSVKNPLLVGGIAKNQLERRLSAKIGSLLGEALGALFAEHREAIASWFPSFSFRELFGIDVVVFPASRVKASRR